MNRFSLDRLFGRHGTAVARQCLLATAALWMLADVASQGQTTETAPEATAKAESGAAASGENGAFAQRQDSGNEERGRGRSGWGDRGSFGGGFGRNGRSQFGRGGSGGSGTVNRDLPPDQQPVAVAGEGKLRFNSRNQPWRDVIAWYAEQAGLSLVGDVFNPEGTFNYQSSKDEALTPTEALDKLNYVLHTKGCTLIRRDDTLMLVDLRNELPPGFVPTIEAKDLDTVGDFEFVNVLFRLNSMSLEDAQSEIENLRGMHSSVKTLPKTRQLSVTDTAGRLKAIKRVIDMVENPDANATENLKSLAVHSVKAEDALNLVKQLLNIPADRSNTADGSLRIVADPIGRRLLVSGKPDAIQRVEDVIATLDGNVQPGNALVRSPQLEIYPLTGVDPTNVHQVLQTLLVAEAASVRLSVDSQGRLIAYAPPDVHSTIQATIRQMQQDGRQIDVMRLMTIDPQQAVVAINKLFTGADGTVKSGLNVQAMPETGSLMVYATRGEIDQIRGMLAQMGETDLARDRVAGRDEHMRVIPHLTGRNARNVITQIEQIWPTIHKSKVHVITPSATQPTAGEGAFRGAVSHEDDGIAERRPSSTSPVGAGIPESASGDTRKQRATPPSRGAIERTAREPAVAPTSTPKKVQPEVNQEASADREIELQLGDLLAPAEAQSRLPVVLVNQRGGEEPKVDAAPAEDAQTQSPPSERLVPFPGPSGNAPGDDRQVASDTPEADNGAAQVRIGDGSPIFVAPGPGGVMIASEDQKALDDFEALLKTLATRSAGRGQEYTVFYLKHAKAQTIGPLVSNILSSSSSSSLARANPLGDFGGRGRGGFAAALSNVTQLTTSSTSAPPSIIPDSRLNALFVQANASDLDSIEQLLKVLDQPESPEDVSIVPKPRMIPVRYKSAEQIASVVKEVYSNRLIGGGGGSRGGRGGGDQGGDARERFIAALRGGDNGGGRGGFGGRGGGGGFGGRGGRSEQEELQQMTIGVDVPSNSLVVSAPELLFQEVQQLVDELDTATSDANNDTMRVVTLRQSSPEAVQQALSQLVGDQVQTSGVRNSRNSSSRNSSSRNSSRGSGGSESFRSFGGGFGGFGGGGFGRGGDGGNRGGFNGGGRGGFDGGGRGGFGGGGGRGGRGD